MGLIKDVCEYSVQAVDQLVETFLHMGWQLIQIL